MLLRSMFAANYRSLRSIRMDLAGVNLFIGENGVGKSNLYRALQLVQAAVRGNLAYEIAAEGGMASALWSGQRRQEKNFRIKLEVEVLDEERAVTFRYRVEAGLRPPIDAAGFAFEPQVKEEELVVETGSRPVTMMKRTGPGIMVRGTSGRMEEYPEKAMTSETAIALLGDAGHYPEAGAFRRLIDGWRFFHGFRTDRDSTLRQPCLAVTSPLLDQDGGNMAAVFATLVHTRGDTVELDQAVAAALGGAKLYVPEPNEYAEFGLVFPDFPKRIFQPRELSDGQIRFLGLAAALMSYRQPPLIALNEPEASLHPDMLPPLADMIAQAARHSQVWIVTHSELLASAVEERCGTRPRRVIRKEGATWIQGMRLTGVIDDEDGDE
ncbi:AAA family ATPase [Neorhizobium galegae]|uniref:AAA family ATPase n=1 Tax=Neorhizobium galegae TaxID=399 RepID=UPI0006229E04|nr:AAA family ATPase [Neorhizobium galegae]CDZ27094.1 Putative RecF protein [Neorhizobium galegae bv. officinalis]KAA9388786.1 AAA family ATPase [Neorhizobium galegae]KAB1116358.1 AAA family ATPase [Neorhizobium galegae]MCM2497673.1 AAA family ATPase [Neorhizobium galegae]MCQ1774646.1 AAA family ATPase [Neorhizobium galegae]